MLGSGVVPTVLAKVVYAAACLGAVVVIVVAGYAHNVVGLTKQIEGLTNASGGGVSVKAHRDQSLKRAQSERDALQRRFPGMFTA